MFIAKDKFEKTAWYMAAEKGQLEVLHKLWEWAKELLTQEEIKYVFVDKDGFGRTA